ncbi:TetR/AcrR family transcriptional regulator [Mammaliicoccus stepanovicii]|uniref:Biofilm operon icaADBC HTH-type negative transcriptional regulator IcaR n=1 Tax=Mammaliicoccus stepanovicii TaxID=643214 RepID=A0A240A521_9STAP|nr:TetR/AcrR family transcriptional regulator [Mammaliicoccus stepanovicii]PNZ71915.1 hypothetical protein CD111_11620 [Mammaliicoccus stepanovicii]GGI39455.1 biofilm operon icaADBC HTH-type negative transcriptional regulator IcaR [Mammaliicoccus stepanovicii]SNV77986.1 intercellular adhesion regulator [Mammaliicoccus stepanovicii]
MKDTSERLIQISMQAFSEKGYHGTSLNNIAESLSIKKASLYNYINSKDELYELCLKQCIKEGMDIIENINPYSSNMREEFLRFFHEYLFESDTLVKFYVQLSFAPSKFTQDIEFYNNELSNSFKHKLIEVHEIIKLEMEQESFILTIRMFINGWLYRRAFIQSKSTQNIVKNEFNHHAEMLLNQVMEI